MKTTTKGFVLLTCYIIQSETSYHLYLIKKVGTDLAYMTGSDGNILSFFTKQDGEVESEAAPPSKDSYSCEDEGLQLKDMCSSNTASSKTDLSHKSGKMVTFYSDSVSDCSKDDRQCNWESCSKNAQKYECSASTKPDCTEEPMMVDKWHFMRTSYCQNPAECSAKSNQSGPEMVTTRVCVEVGVIKNGDRGDNMMETPTIVLCSVDVEPCPGNVVELNEIMVKTITDTTHQSPDILNHETLKYSIDSSSTTTPLPDNIPENVVEPTQNNESSTVDNQNDSDVLDRITQDLDYLLNRNTESNSTADVIESKPRLPPLTYIPEEDNELESNNDKNVDTES
ncbi:hypothetical protein LSTR_LSTR015107 [Laodelphax striatellus]|uniref:Uncharacterized protein n=1 Tax=Laodelphax striatellus TaxID=195883 RepID=A0A482XED9_LAOST|nr:hypothetical protein LSTR_LSTR015107 [Laodelphax striatellus]